VIGLTVLTAVFGLVRIFGELFHFNQGRTPGFTFSTVARGACHQVVL
jgi:hypothetical protein